MGETPVREEIQVESSDGSTHRYFVFNEDPRFAYPLPRGSDVEDIPIYRGDTLVRTAASGETERRPIVGVMVVDSVFWVALKILAPLRVAVANSEAPLIKFAIGTTQPVEFRPGTVIIGGRGTGFYDDEGIILEAHHIGGDPNRDEDWTYYVIGKSNFGRYAPNWITLNEINAAIAAPTSILHFPVNVIAPIEELLASGERELFAYLVGSPEKLAALNPKQFEQLVGAIYKNCGFSVEHLGAWNQEDGGVDIVAISKTVAGTELRLAIQCKTSKNKVSAKPIRELAGVLDAFRAHQGVVVTTSEFTSSAKDEARGSLWKVSLHDRDELIRRMVSILAAKANIPF